MNGTRDEARERARELATEIWGTCADPIFDSKLLPMIEKALSAERAAGERAGLERAAQLGDVARPRVKPKPRKALLTAEEGYDAAMVDYSDHIRALAAEGGRE